MAEGWQGILAVWDLISPLLTHGDLWVLKQTCKALYPLGGDPEEWWALSDIGYEFAAESTLRRFVHFRPLLPAATEELDAQHQADDGGTAASREAALLRVIDRDLRRQTEAAGLWTEPEEHGRWLYGWVAGGWHPPRLVKVDQPNRLLLRARLEPTVQLPSNFTCIEVYNCRFAPNQLLFTFHLQQRASGYTTTHLTYPSGAMHRPYSKEPFPLLPAIWSIHMCCSATLFFRAMMKRAHCPALSPMP